VKHALLVSWLFPPHTSIGARRAYKFARHLPAHGWNATVLCGRAPPARSIDPSPWSVPPDIEVVADYDAAWLTALANRADARATADRRTPEADETDDRSKLTRSIAERVLAGTGDWLKRALPTETIAVHLPHALRRAFSLARDRVVDVVWTTSYPFSAHAIGVALKRRLGIPFVADLRDPWTLNFTHDERPAPTRAVERALERTVFAAADRITVTTESLADAYREMYPRLATKFTTVRNGFEPVALPDSSPTPSPVRLVHFGHIYGARSLGPIFRALSRLRARHGWTSADVVLDNYGRLSDADRAEATRLGLSDCVRLKAELPYVEGLTMLRDAQLLLLPAWGSARGRYFLPGKLYDYLLVGRPILAIGDNAELAAILRATRAGVLCAASDSDAIERHIESAVRGRWRHAPDAAAVADFSVDRTTTQLAAIFDAVSTPQTS